MNRKISIIGAPSSIGLRPYADGSARRLDLAPQVLRESGLCSILNVQDRGDVLQSRGYRDVARPQGRPRNEDDVMAYSRELAERIASIPADDFVLLLGGDCSILLGALLGLRIATRIPVGLVYLDAHADFATLEESPSGSAASMCLALATGRNDTQLARLALDGPLLQLENLVHIGRRDDEEPWYGHHALSLSPALNIPQTEIREKGVTHAAGAALDRLVHKRNVKFWIHVDADVLDSGVMQAVDSPLPGGMDLEELRELLTVLVHHPCALGLQLTIYDPSLDADRVCASRLVKVLASSFQDVRPRAGGAA